jgi:hypothetical protein
MYDPCTTEDGTVSDGLRRTYVPHLFYTHIFVPRMSEREFVGTLNAQLVGRIYYPKANSTTSKTFSLSRNHPTAVTNKKYDDNSTVVLNERGEVVGSLARDFAAIVAPMIDGSLAKFECTVPKVAGMGGSLSLMYHLGESVDLHVRVYAKPAHLPKLESLGVLGKLTKCGSGDAPVPVPRSSVPFADRAREEGYTNLKDTSDGKFSCYLVTDECEVMFQEKIRYPEAWLKSAQFPDWAEEAVIYRAGAAPEKKDKEVLRKSLLVAVVPKEVSRSKRHKKE